MEALTIDAIVRKALREDLGDILSPGVKAQPCHEFRLVAQLRQLVSPVWNENLLNEESRDFLMKGGLVDRVDGWNFLTLEGVKYCVTLGILRR
jgi:hypothetical protein